MIFFDDQEIGFQNFAFEAPNEVSGLASPDMMIVMLLRNVASSALKSSIICSNGDNKDLKIPIKLAV